MGAAVALAFAIGLGAVGGTAGVAGAQALEPPTTQQGYYMGGGLQLFWGAFFGSKAPDHVENLSGSQFRLRAGEMVTPAFGLGFALDFGGGSPMDVDSKWVGMLSAMSVETRWRPWIDRGWAVHAGIGAGGALLTNPDDTNTSTEAIGGVLWRLGASYTVFPWYEPEHLQSGGASFNFYLEAQAMVGDRAWMPALMLGVEFLWWTGVDRNKLDLPPDAAFAPEP